MHVEACWEHAYLLRLHSTLHSSIGNMIMMCKEEVKSFSSNVCTTVQCLWLINSPVFNMSPSFWKEQLHNWCQGEERSQWLPCASRLHMVKLEIECPWVAFHNFRRTHRRIFIFEHHKTLPRQCCKKESIMWKAQVVRSWKGLKVKLGRV